MNVTIDEFASKDNLLYELRWDLNIYRRCKDKLYVQRMRDRMMGSYLATGRWDGGLAGVWET